MSSWLATTVGLAFLVLARVDAAADPFVIQPNGDLAVNTTFTTQGIFTCPKAIACLGSGTSSVTLFSGESTLTLSFTGVQTSFLVGNRVMPVELGAIESVPTGEGFRFPTRANREWSVLNFALAINTSSPNPRTLHYNWHSNPGGGTTLNFFGGPFLAFALPPNPAGFEYTHVAFTIDPFGPQSRAVTVSSAPGTVGISANVGLIPEPSTVLLMGTGLARVLYRVRRNTHRR